MQRVKSILGYTGAALTVLAAVLIPFVLIDRFTRGVAATGVRVAPGFSGGDPSHTLDRGAYRIVVHRPVRKTAPLERLEPYVQLVWTPASALPERVSDSVDIDNDGRPDLKVTFAVPRDRKTPLRAEATSLTPLVRGGAITRDAFSSIIARVGKDIVVRVPIR